MKYVWLYIVVINLIVNLYKCLVFGYEVFVYVVWLVFNWLLMIWILSVWGLLMCFELWSVDVLINLYLVFVVVFEVGLDGIKNGIELLKSVDCNIYVMDEDEWVVVGIVDLLLMLYNVLKEFQIDLMMKKVLGLYIYQSFLEVKWFEWVLYC